MPETPTASPAPADGATAEPDDATSALPDGPSTDDDATGVAPTAVVGGRSAATSLLTWGTVALILVIVVVLVVLKITGSTPTTTVTATPPPQPAPSSVIQAVTDIPSSVYATVGITSPDEAVSAPASLRGQPALKINGKPGVVFVGSEFCPYCAAQRWGLVAALSRFGKWSLLPAAQSAADEAFPGTPTFSFAGARYKSPYIGVRLIETFSNQKNRAGTSYGPLDHLSKKDKALLDHYGRATGSSQGAVTPFLDIANQSVVSGGSFSPSVFEQLTMAQIASGLSDAKDPATQAIVSDANYVSAAICAADGGMPTKVCTSKGVLAAAGGAPST